MIPLSLLFRFSLCFVSLIMWPGVGLLKFIFLGNLYSSNSGRFQPLFLQMFSLPLSLSLWDSHDVCAGLSLLALGHPFSSALRHRIPGFSGLQIWTGNHTSSFPGLQLIRQQTMGLETWFAHPHNKSLLPIDPIGFLWRT